VRDRSPISSTSDERVAPRPALWIERSRIPHARRRTRIPKVLRHDAHDRAVDAAEAQLTTDDRRIRPEFLPERVAQNRGRFSARRIVARLERASEHRWRTKDVEELSRDGHALHELKGGPVTLEGRIVTSVCGDVAEAGKMAAKIKKFRFIPRVGEVEH